MAKPAILDKLVVRPHVLLQFGRLIGVYVGKSQSAAATARPMRTAKEDD